MHLFKKSCIHAQAAPNLPVFLPLAGFPMLVPFQHRQHITTAAHRLLSALINVSNSLEARLLDKLM